MGQPKRRTPRQAVLAFEIFEEEPVAVGGVLVPREPPTEFRIFEFGPNTALKSPGTFMFDEDAAKLVMGAFKRQGRGFLNFDYEHGATIGNGEPAPSAGRWVPEVRNGELWATQIRWAPRAAQLIANREYELFSPWFTHEEDPPYRITSLLNCALTNTPALENAMPLIAASTASGDEMPNEKDEKDKKIEELTAALAKATKDNEEMKASIAALSSKASEEEEEKEEELKVAAELKTSLAALTGKPSVAAALGVLEGWKTKASVADKLTAEMETVKTAKLTADFEAVFVTAKESGVAVASANDIREKALKFGGGKVTETALDFASAALGVATKVPGQEVKHPAANVEGIVSERQAKMALSLGKDPKKFAEYKAKTFLGA